MENSRLPVPTILLSGRRGLPPRPPKAYAGGRLNGERSLSLSSRSPSPSPRLVNMKGGRGLSASPMRRLSPAPSNLSRSTLQSWGLIEETPSTSLTSADEGVVFSGGLSFIIDRDRSSPVSNSNKAQVLRSHWKAHPAHTMRETGSSRLTCQIQDFLSRTDHVAEAWSNMKGLPQDAGVGVAVKNLRSSSAAAILVRSYQLANNDDVNSKAGSSALNHADPVDDDAGDTANDIDEVSELSVELSEEQATSTLASERLSAETGERKRLEREVQDLQERFETVQQSNDRLESEVLLRRALGINGDLHSEGSRTNSIDEDDVDSRDAVLALQRKCERALQEVAFLKKQMHQQHEDDMDQMMTLKKQLEKKVSEAYEEAEEQRQVSGQWKRKSQKATAELNDLKLLLEEQTSRNALLEKKQRRFDADLQSMQRQLTNEQQQKEQVARERDSIQAQQFASEQSLAALRLDLEVSQNETASLRNELEELSMGGRMEEEVGNLRRQRQEMTTRLREQEEELDDLAGQVQLLEQAKLRLEMALETARKDHRRELQQRDEEVEDARASAAKKYKVLEAQLENEHEERTILLREKHELERKLAEAREAIGRAAEGGENVSRLRRELRHTKALLRDAHTMLERTQEDAPSKALLRQLKNQLEDADLSRAAAMKARQNAEMELAECQMQMDESQRIRSETEERLARILREKTELQAQLDENEEELAEVMKKYKASVQQVSSDQATMQEQAVLLAETESQRNLLREQLAELQARLEAMETDSAASAVQRRLQLKLREAESKLELESTTRARLETQANRLKESVEKLQEEALSLRTKEQMSQEAARRLQRQMHDCREEQAALQHRESSALQKAIASEQRLEAAEVEIASLRADLKLALQRIDDLQAAMHAPSDDSDSNTDDDSDFELDLALPRRHVGEGDADVDDFQLSNMPAAPNNTFSSPSRESQA